MAGKPGRSGSGGARPGAGRKPKPKEPAPEPVLIAGDCDMLELLQRVALGLVEATPIQVRAAIAAVQYTHVKKGEGGKKDAKDAAAKEAGQGRFAPASGPRLVVNNGK